MLAAFHQYQVPVIELGRRTSREAACLVFEKVNTGGKKLDAFELLTAIYAGEEEVFHLREEWAVIAKRLSDSIALKQQPLTWLQATDFFQALALLYTRDRRVTHVSTNRAGDLCCSISDCTMVHNNGRHQSHRFLYFDLFQNDEAKNGVDMSELIFKHIERAK